MKVSRYMVHQTHLVKYPEPQNVRTDIVPMDGIVTLVDSRTRSGHVYMYYFSDMTFTKQLHTHITTEIDLYYMPSFITTR